MTTVYWNDVNHADYAIGSKHTVGGQTLIVAGHGPAGVVLTENGEMPAVGENKSCGRSSDVVVSRLIWPLSGMSANSAEARRAGAPTA